MPGGGHLPRGRGPRGDGELHSQKRRLLRVTTPVAFHNQRRGRSFGLPLISQNPEPPRNPLPRRLPEQAISQAQDGTRAQSGARRLSDREGVAVRIPEVGYLGAALERGDALLVRYGRPFVVALEGDAPGIEFLYDPLDVVDAPASQGRRRLARVLRREVDVHHASLRAPVLHVVARVDTHRKAELAFVELPGSVHIGNREPCAHLVPAQAHPSLLALSPCVKTNTRQTATGEVYSYDPRVGSHCERKAASTAVANLPFCSPTR